jgi:hypothetical protein
MEIEDAKMEYWMLEKYNFPWEQNQQYLHIYKYTQQLLIMCSFHLKIPMWLVKKLTHDLEIETSSLNDVHNHSTTPTSMGYFKVVKTTHNNMRNIKANNNFNCI